MAGSAAPKKFTLKAGLGVTLMMIFGTGTMISSKILINTKARGCVEGADEVNFNKALYQSIVMFFGMAICLPVYFISKVFGFQKSNEPANETLSVEEQRQNRTKTLVNYLLISIPASFDLIATTMMTVGLFYIDVSIVQMLRGSMIIFSALLTVLVKKDKLTGYQWLGVISCSIAILIVGLSTILGGGSQQNDSPVGLKILGILLVVASQFVQASQVVVEGYLLADLKAPALVVVGMEGIWGFILSTVVFMPLFYFIPGTDGSGGLTWWKSSIGHFEDMYDTICMLGHKSILIYATLIYWFSIIVLNYGGMVVTQETSAVVRTIFEALRTFFIWVVQVFIFYVIKWDNYGESLNWFSFMEASGFALLVLSLFIYNAVIKLRCLPFLHYETKVNPPAPQEEVAYSAMGSGVPTSDPSYGHGSDLMKPIMHGVNEEDGNV